MTVKTRFTGKCNICHEIRTIIFRSNRGVCLCVDCKPLILPPPESPENPPPVVSVDEEK